MLACLSLLKGWGKRDEHVCHVGPQTVSLIIKAVETLDYLLVLSPHVAGPMEGGLPSFEPRSGFGIYPHPAPMCTLSVSLVAPQSQPVIKV